MSENDYVALLSSFMSGFKPQIERNGDAYILRLPGFEPLPWYAPRKKKLFSRRNPNEIFYEESTTAVFAFFLARIQNRIVLDAGAQWGYFTALALAYQAHAIDAYAFEINPHATAYLKQAIADGERRGRRGELLLSGLSDVHAGERDIWISTTRMFESEPTEPEYRDPWWIRLKMTLRGNKDRDVPQKFRVLITSIDHFCQERALAPGLIKIDVDGYEAKVIPGAIDTLEHHKPVVFLELHKRKFTERFGVTRRDIVAPLFDLGYRAILLDDHHDRLSAATPVTIDSPQIVREATDMFVFIHPQNLDAGPADLTQT